MYHMHLQILTSGEKHYYRGPWARWARKNYFITIKFSFLKATDTSLTQMN